MDVLQRPPSIRPDAVASVFPDRWVKFIPSNLAERIEEPRDAFAH
jgi:hypothetical protein